MALHDYTPKFACAYGFIIEDYNIATEYCRRHNLDFEADLPQDIIGTDSGTFHILKATVVPHLRRQLGLKSSKMLRVGIAERIPIDPHPDLDENYQIQRLLPVVRFCKWKGEDSPTMEDLDLCVSQNVKQSIVQHVKDHLQLTDPEEPKWYPKATYV
ncbi:hypothetical protein C8Q79DRAFT_1010250 [Trametes meyenii]|nr:hypothetical protein C8Q79DRAFT_1010250 [Trametes meyenii]